MAASPMSSPGARAGGAARPALHRIHARRNLLVPRPRASTARPAAFYIDPVRQWSARSITHAHADHATRGHGAVLATRETLDIMAMRLGAGLRRPDGGGGAPASRSASAASTATFHPAGHVLGSAQIAVEGRGSASWSPATTSAGPTRPARPSSRCRATSSSPRRPSACRSSATGRRRGRSASCSRSLAQFPERTHLVGVYALGKAQRHHAAAARRRPRRADLPARGAAPALRLLRRARHRRSARSPTPRWHAARARLRRGRSCSGRRRRSRGPGSAASPTRWSPSPPAGCRCAPAPASAASSCRWSSPITATGTSSPRTMDRARARRGLGDAWPRGGAGPLVRAPGHAGAAAAPGRLRGRGRVTRSRA